MSNEGSRGHRFVLEDGSSVAVAAVAMLLCARGRANSVPCAFLTIALPALLVVVSRAYRQRVVAGARALWASLDDATGLPWRAALVFVVIPAVLVYLSNDHSESNLDSCPVVPTAVSLITQGNTDLDEFYGAIALWRRYDVTEEGVPYFLKRSGGHVYSSYPSGMVPFAVPVAGLARLVGARLTDPFVLMRLEKLTASVVSGLILGVSSGMWSTVGQSLWQHDGVVLGTLVVLLIEFHGPGKLGTVAQGVVCGMLPACRVTSVAFLAPFGLWVLLRSPRRALLLAVAAAVAAAPWAAYYWSVYGSPVGPTTSQMKGSLWSTEFAVPLAGVLVSPGRGLLVYQPWVVLALLCLVPGVRRAGARPEVAGVPFGWEWVCAGAVVFLVGVVSAWSGWHGGYCWGSRLVVEVVPLCALLCARPVAALGATARGRALVIGLALLGVMLQVPGVYLGAYRWNVVYSDVRPQAVWSWSRAPFLAPFNLPGR